MDRVALHAAPSRVWGAVISVVLVARDPVMGVSVVLPRSADAEAAVRLAADEAGVEVHVAWHARTIDARFLPPAPRRPASSRGRRARHGSPP
ncbi:MAG: hypothetical protein QOF51_1049 [Chloroflexota bacterium]|jgi:hypothetical protein|nr:hypothetical protein [Chloroflexota bacterium]